MLVPRRRVVVLLIALVLLVLLWRDWGLTEWTPSVDIDSVRPQPQPQPQPHSQPQPGSPQKHLSYWSSIPHHFPITSFRQLPPKSTTSSLGRVQADFPTELAADRQQRIARQDAIKDAFVKCWETYRAHAWLSDEVTPISARPKDTFGGWGATLIDSLDTLWIMGLRDEFDEAVDAVHRHISFNTTEAKEINVFETTIRFLGGLLAAYDLSGDERLLAKSTEVGDMLYKAFDTPNHLPVTRWDLHAAARGDQQSASSHTLLAEMGSLCLEFTRLTMVTGDPKYYDAVQHIGELLHKAQPKTKLPGLWPIVVDAVREDFDATGAYSLGGMADSTYEYLPKMLALLGDSDDNAAASIYRDMYTRSMDAVEDYLLFQPMTLTDEDILFPGVAHATVSAGGSKPNIQLQTTAGHLTCFTGGMFALGGQLLSDRKHLEHAAQLTDGCVWAYQAFATGVMPETFDMAGCPHGTPCEWDEAKWHKAISDRQGLGSGSETAVQAAIANQHLPPGFTKITDARYILRPEAVESVFYMYRATGEKQWADKAWAMWRAVDELTHTELANTAVWNMNPGGAGDGDGGDVGVMDSMESFWMGETLKYLYLVFAEPGLLSLDAWVFNTEAHPFRRRV